MFKTSSTELIEIVKTLDKANFAINTLERNGQNKILFFETKKQIQDLSEKIKDRYGLREFNDFNECKKTASIKNQS